MNEGRYEDHESIEDHEQLYRKEYQREDCYSELKTGIIKEGLYPIDYHIDRLFHRNILSESSKIDQK